jgi:hypothetical protein
MKYLIPYVYGFTTRANTIFYKISFLLVVVLPILLSIILLNTDITYITLRFLLAFTAMYIVYEIGYIFNDTYTVRFEKNPTHRLNKEERYKVERLANLLISVRIFLVIICILLLNYLEIKNLSLFVVMLGLLGVSYAFHNYYRNKLNIITIFFVLVFKYISVPVLFVPISKYIYLSIILILMVPIIRTIEFASKEKYKIKLFNNFNLDIFRIWYYLFLTIVFIILSIINSQFIIALLLASYFLIFRIMSYTVLKSKNIGKKIKKIRGTKSI